jgi:hypothetical protein
MVTTPPRVAYAVLRWLHNGGSFGREDEDLRRGGLHVLRNLGEVPARLKRRRRCVLITSSYPNTRQLPSPHPCMGNVSYLPGARLE